MTSVRIRRAMPFLRLALIAVAVVIGDAATGQISARGITMEPLVVAVVRFATAAAVLVMPLTGAVLALEADKWDWYWLGMGSRPEAAQALYQDFDKLADLVFLGCAAVVLLRWPDRRLRLMAAATFFLRALGVAAYLASGWSWLLLAFPNVFEHVMLLAFLFRVLTGHVRVFDSAAEAWGALIALSIPKVVAEYFIHIRKDRPWDVVALPVPDWATMWTWGVLTYGLPLLALLYLMATAEGRATKGDPEEEMAVL